MLKYVKLFFVFALLFILTGCTNSKIEIKDFNEDILPILNEFKDFYIKDLKTDLEEPRKLSKYTRRKLYSENISILFPNIDQSLKEKIQKIIFDKEIQSIRFYGGSCIEVIIYAKGNSLFQSSWNELCLIHDDDINDKVLCFNGRLTNAVEIKDLGSSWKLVLYKQYRVIGG